MAFCEPLLAPILEQAGAEFPVFNSLPDLASMATVLPAVESDDQALIIYTSGTTARPKGVIHTAGSLFQKGLKGAGISRHISDQIRLCVLEPIQCTSRVCGFWQRRFYEGSPMVLLPKFEPAAALDAIARFGCTTAGGLPTMILSLVEEQTRNTPAGRYAAVGNRRWRRRFAHAAGSLRRTFWH